MGVLNPIAPTIDRIDNEHFDTGKETVALILR